MTQIKATVKTKNGLRICIFAEPNLPGLNSIRVQVLGSDGQYNFTERFNNYSTLQPLRFLTDEEVSTVVQDFSLANLDYVETNKNNVFNATQVEQALF